MKHLFTALAFGAISLILNSCSAPLQQEVLETSADNHYKDLRNLNPDSLSYDELYDRALGLWDVPFEERDCDTKLGKAHVIVAGPTDAPPLVLLHGMNASSTSWYPNISAFAATHRVYAIDFILEVNKSEMTTEPSGTEDVLKWYEEVFSCLELDKFDLLGASRGGWLATQLALKAPQRIKKLVLLSPAQTFIWIPASKEMFTNISYTLQPNRDELREALGALSNDVDKIDQLYIDQYFIATQKAEVDASIFKMTPLDEKDFTQLTMPVLVLVGDNDFANSKKSLKIAENDIPNITTSLIKEAGHFISIDQSDKVNAEVIKFLDGKN